MPVLYLDTQPGRGYFQRQAGQVGRQKLDKVPDIETARRLPCKLMPVVLRFQDREIESDRPAKDNWRTCPFGKGSDGGGEVGRARYVGIGNIMNFGRVGYVLR